MAQRNGYRHRPLDTRVGTIDVAIPRLRQGTYFPEWLLERRKRAETALITVVVDCYLAGVSTRRMAKLVETLGIDSLSKSQVSVMAKELDEHVEQFHTRRLEEAGPFTFVVADALVLKVREGGRCRTHYSANLMSAPPKTSWPWVKALLHSIYDQPDADAVHAQFDRVVDALHEKLPTVAEHLEDDRADILAFTPFPKEI